MFEPHTLRAYALIADGERGALIGPKGDIAWLCFPGWADEGIFASLLGAGSGYVVQPEGRFVWGGYYEPGSLIWRSRWVTADGIVECREALALPSRPDRAVLLRRIEVLEGAARVHVELRPLGDWGRGAVRDLEHAADGVWRGRAGDVPFAWQGGRAARLDGFDLALEAGQAHDLVLVLGPDGVMPDADAAWARTAAAWRGRVPGLCGTAADGDARHALAVLSGLTAATGAMVAAATTALPERADQGRNYDYRYAWIRDQCLAGRGLAAAGAWPHFDANVSFIVARLLEHGAGLAPAYTVGGAPIPGEHHLGLPGYPGGTDVAGNHVNEQFQLDGFGEALLLLATAARADRLEADGVEAAALAADAVAARWEEPDAGVWELEPRHWTESRLTCVAGLRAIAAAAPGAAGAGRWLELADAILAETRATARHPSGRWQRAPDDPRVDASLLLPGPLAATGAADAIAGRTLSAVERELCDDGYCYRYRPDDRPLGDAEGAFLLCGLALSLALEASGDRTAAARVFDRTRSASGPPGLLAEEFDVQQRQLRGNLPQAFVHAMLLECAVRLGDA